VADEHAEKGKESKAVQLRSVKMRLCASLHR
jgi:hypothetical protein